MSGPKIETIITIDSTNQTLPLKMDGDLISSSITLTAGEYFMGESYLDRDSLLGELYDQINTTMKSTSTVSSVSNITITSSRFLQITAANDFQFNFKDATSISTAGSCPAGDLLGFHTGVNSGTSASCVLTATEQIGFCWFGDDVSNDINDAALDNDQEGMTGQSIAIRGLSGHRVTNDINEIETRVISLTFIPPEKCFGHPYGKGYGGKNLSFETDGGSGDATNWDEANTDADFFTNPGTDTKRVTGTWDGTNTAKTGDAFYQIGDDASHAANEDTYGQVSQTIDLTGIAALRVASYIKSSASSAEYSQAVLIGSTSEWAIPTTPTLDTHDAYIIIDVSDYDGWNLVVFRNTKTSANGTDHIAAWQIDNVQLKEDSQHTREVNKALQSWWLKAKAGNRFRYYQDASERGEYKTYLLAEGSTGAFNPTRYNQVTDLYSYSFEVVEYIA